MSAVHFRWRNENRVANRVVGFPRKGRASLTVGENLADLCAEWSFPSRTFSLGLRASDDGERTATLKLCVPPASLYISVESWRLAKLLRHGARSWQRTIDLRVFDWAVWWNLWVDDSCWTSDRPRWRDGSWRPFGFPGKRLGEPVLLEEREVDVPFPAKTFRARASKFLVTRRSSAFPLLRVTQTEVELDFEHLAEKPESRKGGIWKTSGPARSIEEAVGQFVADELPYNRASAHQAAE